MAEKTEEKKNQKDASPEEDLAKGKKKKLILFGLIGGILVAGIAGGSFFFLASGGSKDHKLDSASLNETVSEGDTKSSTEKVKEKPTEIKDSQEQENKSKVEEKKNEAKEISSTDQPATEKKKEDKKISDKKIEGLDFGCTIALGPFHLNLGNPLENRYIRLDLAIEYGCSEDQKEEIEKRIPQLKNAVISVTARKTREFLLGPDGKEQLRKEILNRVNHYMSKKIDDVYITEIIIE